MILCVDTTVLKESLEIQKDIGLGNILDNHTKYFNIITDAYKEHYTPLDFSVSIRSLYTNLVLEREQIGEDGKELKLYYRNITNAPEVIHKGLDLIMYMTSLGVMTDVKYSTKFEEIMAKHSMFRCMGLYNPCVTLVNPCIYSHVILTDEGAEALKSCLREGRQFVHIEEMQTEGNAIPMLNTLKIIGRAEDE